MKKVLLPLMIALMSTPLSAQTYHVLHHIGGNSSDGYAPAADLVLSGSTLYGTTISGGKGGNGILFKLNTAGTGFTNLHNFAWDDGANPGAGVVISNGVLYGTTESGGSSGNGTVFMVNTDGTSYTVLKSFPALVPAYFGTNSDGAKPTGDLVLDSGTLYGTANGGGPSGNGTVFKINTDGLGFTVLKAFSALFQGTNNVSGNFLIHGTNIDGANPVAGLVLGGSTLYGTTFHGGISSNGVVFAIQTDGTGFTVLKNFSGLNNGTNSDGANPRAGLALGGDTLYGMTVNGGSLYDGTLFKLNTNGTCFAVLKNYYYSDGAWPYNTLLLNGHTLYGTTFAGGTTNKGTIFKVNTDGSDYTVLKNMNPTDGFYSYSRLVLSGSTLYGTTYYGGSNYDGVVFSLAVPPQIQVADGSFGVQSNVFGFNVAGVSNQVVVVEACTDLTATVWLPLQTNTLGSDPVYFNDPTWKNFLSRFYRVRGQ